MRDKSTAIILCRTFLPYSKSLGSCIRMVTLANFLKKNNFKVYVVTSDGYNYGFMGMKSLLKNIKIFYSKDPIKYLWEKPSKSTGGKTNDKNKRRVDFFKKSAKFFIKELFVPDDGILCYKDYINTVESIINKNPNKTINIITSGPSHSIHLVGRRIKGKYNDRVNWVMDYRDSWNTHEMIRKKVFLTNYISKLLEKSCIISSDFISYVSEPIIKKIEDSYKLKLQQKSLLVMNGFQKTYNTKSTNQKKTKILTIGHFGPLNDNSEERKLSYVVEALDNIKNSENFELHLYGDSYFSTTKTENYPQIKVFEKINHNQANQKMTEMDFLLILHTSDSRSEEVITGKFFEYVAAKKPIISIGPLNMEVCKLIKKDSLGICIDYKDSDEIAKVFSTLSEIDKTKFHKDLDIKKYSREFQYKKFLSILK